MCRFASFKYNLNQPAMHDVIVADWFSHGNTEKMTGKTEKDLWYDGHYLPEGNIECRTPDGTSSAMQKIIRERWPTFVDFMRWALTQVPDPNIKDSGGQTALYRAACGGHDACVKLLLSAKADPNIKASDGRTALYRAACDGHDACVKLLEPLTKK